MSSALRGRGTILIVDDEPMVRNVARLTLERDGYDVLLAGDGEEAVNLFSACAGRVSLVLLDMSMPDMNGAEILSRLRRRDAHVPVLVTSGFGESEVEDRFRKQEICGFLAKPFTARQLVEKVHQLVP